MPNIGIIRRFSTEKRWREMQIQAGARTGKRNQVVASPDHRMMLRFRFCFSLFDGIYLDPKATWSFHGSWLKYCERRTVKLWRRNRTEAEAESGPERKLAFKVMGTGPPGGSSSTTHQVCTGDIFSPGSLRGDAPCSQNTVLLGQGTPPLNRPMAPHPTTKHPSSGQT